MQVAGIVFGVSCLYPTTQLRCREFITDATADCTVTIGEADLEAERALLLSKKAPGAALEASTPQALEILRLCRRIAELLPQRNTLLFHGSCLAIDGKGVLFTAKSGTGKSTHTRLWREVFGDRVVMINDDKPFLGIGPNGITAYGTPWLGKHSLGGNLSAPLTALCILCRGEENRIEAVSPREALPMLLQQTYTPDDPQAMAKTLALVQQLSKNVAIYRLYCNMDPQAAITARDGMFNKEI